MTSMNWPEAVAFIALVIVIATYLLLKSAP
jgi:hypothetical protein